MPEPYTTGPLAGVRVVDLSTTFMGPYCTLLMAQMGAEVIKVEAPGGDVVRGVGVGGDAGMGPVFLNANRGKRSVVLDLKDPADHRTLLALAATADVFVHAMRPRAAAKLGIGPDDIAAANPRCVYTALQGFGSDGPYRDKAAYDDVIQAVCGLADVQGTGGEPAYVRTPIADKVVGLMALSAILAALYERGDGPGQAVEVPMFETMAGFMLLDQQGGWVHDPPAGPTGYARTSSPHRRPYRTRDGHIGVLVYTDGQWRAFFDLIGRPELAAEPRYATITQRTEHIDELYAMVADALTARTTGEWLAALDAAGVPATPIRSTEDLFTDAHATAVGLFDTVESPDGGTLRQPRFPVRYSRTPPAPVPRAPRLDADGPELRDPEVRRGPAPG
ncbi:MAG TPA: CoA transferase [Streptosporangiaceae bacterium]|jgi:crotonobetainyl-CoA:carnitine CoA-transferase CaiB-like acyl-CoA transferase